MGELGLPALGSIPEKGINELLCLNLKLRRSSSDEWMKEEKHPEKYRYPGAIQAFC